MKNISVKKLALAGMLCALCVVGSVFSFPMFGSKCAPVQHMVNVLCAVLLGPWWGVGVAFVASLLRNLLGLGSLMAFPGSMFGALLCGLVYHKTKNLLATVAGEVFGTSVLGGLCAYPVATMFMNVDAAATAVRRTRSVIGNGSAMHGEARRGDMIRRADKEHTAAGAAACFITGNRSTIHGKGRAGLIGAALFTDLHAAGDRAAIPQIHYSRKRAANDLAVIYKNNAR